MSFCMHHRQGWFHITVFKPTSFCSPLPVLADNVFPEILDTSWYHFFLVYKVCIAIQLSLEHVHCPLSQAMSATYVIIWTELSIIISTSNTPLSTTCFQQVTFYSDLQFPVQSRPIWLPFCHDCLQPSSVSHHIYYQRPVHWKPIKASCHENKLEHSDLSFYFKIWNRKCIF